MRKDLSLYPTIGMNSIGEKVEVNFGNKPFVYDIELHKILQEAHEKDLKFRDSTKKGTKRLNEDGLDKIVILWPNENASIGSVQLNICNFDMYIKHMHAKRESWWFS